MTNLVPDYNNSYICPKCNHQTPQYVKEWVGLTDEEVWQMSQFNCGTRGEFARALEAKLKEKNT
jgi:hypothetical protein